MSNTSGSAPAAPKSESASPKHRYRLDNNTSSTLTLPDGRKLGYAEYGQPTGRAVLYQHGHPGSRLEGALFDEVAREAGIRIIATDRPGMGWSSPHPGRKLLDHPKDLECLAEHLALEEYGVLGISGGGPYALACAKALPTNKLKCVSVVCGLGPPDIGMSGADFVHRIAFTIGYPWCPTPAPLRWFWGKQIIGRVDLSDDERLALLMQRPKDKAHAKDIEAMEDEEYLRVTVRSSRECFAQGFGAILQDGKTMCADWGFRIQDIPPELPVQLWYGRLDPFIPLNHGEQLAMRLGARARLRVEDETHFSISRNKIREIFEELAGKM